MKIVYTGLESAGKTLMLARVADSLVKRNRNWRKLCGFHRLLYSNIVFGQAFYEKNKDWIEYFKDYRDVIDKKGIDIIWDEMSSHFSALKKEPLPLKINQWLRQGAKQGVHIYATCQEFHDLHLDVRRRVKEAYSVSKFMGSPRIGHNLPPVKKIWGLCLVWQLVIHPYNELQPEKDSPIPGFLWITKALCDVFDTGQVIGGSGEPPYEHLVRKCERSDCSYSRVVHK